MEMPHLKEWMSLAEIAKARIAGLPTSKQGMHLHAIRNNWNDDKQRFRRRDAKGGGIEYHISLLGAEDRAVRIVVRPVELVDEVQTARLRRADPAALHVFLNKSELGQLEAAARLRKLPVELIAAHLLRNALNITAVLP